MAVQSDEAQVVRREYTPYCGHGCTVGQRQPELLVLVRGGDELVGVGLHANSDPHENVLDDARGTGDVVEAFDLGHRVEHDMADPGLDGSGQLVYGFVVAVE